MRPLLTALTLALASLAPAQVLPQWPEGDVRFEMIGWSHLDPWINQATPASQAWMNVHYTRMQVYEPFFDPHTSWYQKGWLYKNIYAVKPSHRVFQLHPEWMLRDAAGNLLFVPFDCSNGTCPQYAADFGNPAYRRWWLNEARSLLARGYRGFWIDDVNMTWRVSDGNGTFVPPIDPRTGTEMTLEDWRRYMAEFLELVRMVFPQAELVHNCIWFAAPPGDPYVSRQIQASDYINFERGFNDQGLVGGNGFWSMRNFMGYCDYVHSEGLPLCLQEYTTLDVTQRETGLAGYLLLNEGQDLTASNQIDWCNPGDFWFGYELTLGAAPRSAVRLERPDPARLSARLRVALRAERRGRLVFSRRHLPRHERTAGHHRVARGPTGSGAAQPLSRRGTCARVPLKRSRGTRRPPPAVPPAAPRG